MRKSVALCSGAKDSLKDLCRRFFLFSGFLLTSTRSSKSDGIVARWCLIT